mmetsp:Transcript_8280/g.30278  ORF Transcript_8280/g.30278 Transcript_8280/m.30278 type:complete len:262 (+) Transcript_8280:533-1318(+)
MDARAVPVRSRPHRRRAARDVSRECERRARVFGRLRVPPLARGVPRRRVRRRSRVHDARRAAAGVESEVRAELRAAPEPRGDQRDVRRVERLGRRREAGGRRRRGAAAVVLLRRRARARRRGRGRDQRRRRARQRRRGRVRAAVEPRAVEGGAQRVRPRGAPSKRSEAIRGSDARVPQQRRGGQRARVRGLVQGRAHVVQRGHTHRRRRRPRRVPRRRPRRRRVDQRREGFPRPTKQCEAGASVQVRRAVRSGGGCASSRD